MLAVLVPFVGVLAGLVLGGRHAQRVALLTLVLGLGIAVAIADAAAALRATRWSTCWAAGRRRSASRCAPTGCRWSCCWPWPW